jgi:hypothetical protein
MTARWGRVLVWLGCTLAVGPQTRDVVTTGKNGTAVIAGTVVLDDEKAMPIRRAVVTLAGAEIHGSRQAATDDGGRFVFDGLPAGRYTLTVDKAAYVRSYYGSRRIGVPPAMPIAVAESEQPAPIVIPLMRGAAIEGTISDENGLPVASAQLHAMQAVVMNGERRLVDVPGLATSDDRGSYRLYGLPPGEYTVIAAGGGGLAGSEVRLTTPAEIDLATRELSNSAQRVAASANTSAMETPPAITRAIVYAPGVSDAASAQTFTLAKAEERAGVDIVSRVVRAARVDGVAIAPNGQPLTDMLVGLATLSRGSLYTSPGAIRLDAAGHFSVVGLTPGRYLFFGRAGAGALAGWTSTELSIDGPDVPIFVLQFESGLAVTGRIRFDSASAPPDPASVLHMALTPIPIVPGASMPTPPAVVASDGTFRVSDVAAGRYRLAVTAAAPWSLRSATVGGRELMDGPIDISPGQPLSNLVVTLTDHPTELTGRLVDRLNRPAPEYSVVVFTTDRALWAASQRRMSGVVKLGSDGTFHVTGLPPGEYYLSAVTEATPAQLGDPAFLEQLAQAAMKISLAEGEKKVQDLKLGGG